VLLQAAASVDVQVYRQFSIRPLRLLEVDETPMFLGMEWFPSQLTFAGRQMQAKVAGDLAPETPREKALTASGPASASFTISLPADPFGIRATSLPQLAAGDARRRRGARFG